MVAFVFDLQYVLLNCQLQGNMSMPLVHEPETKRPKRANWKREDIVRCFCSDKKYAHVHCPCDKCNDAAVSTATEISHLQNRQYLDDRTGTCTEM